MTKVKYCTGDACEWKNASKSYKLNVCFSVLATGLAYYYGWKTTSYAFAALTAIFVLAFIKGQKSEDAMEVLMKRGNSFA